MPQVRDVIRDNHNREGIVVEHRKRPASTWIHDQKDQRVASLPEEESWWLMLPFTGGSVLVPGSLATRLRSATYDDVMKAVEGANEHGRKELALVFSEMLNVSHCRLAAKNEADQMSLPRPESAAENENDESCEEEAWIASERSKVIEYLAIHQIDHLGVGEWPAFHVEPYLAVWAIQSKKSPGDVGWWAISGDVPTDYMSGSDADHPRKVLSYFSRQWAEVSEYMDRGEAHPDSKIGRKEDWPMLGPLLKFRSTLLGDFAADEGLWIEE